MLETLKMLLGLSQEADDKLDKKLTWLLTAAQARLKVLLGGIEPPESLTHIIIDVAIIRFNRIGSEGFSSHSVEGESLSFAEDDFAGFKEEIQAFLDTQENATKGRLRFL